MKDSDNVEIHFYNRDVATAIGGGTHARESLRALKRVNQVKIIDRSATGPETNYETRSTLSLLKGLLRRILPYWVGMGNEFWRAPVPRELVDTTQFKNGKRVLYIRPNSQISIIRRIKERRAFDIVCVEVNAIHSLETPRWLPLRHLWIKAEINELNQADLVCVVSGELREQLRDRGIEGSKILVNQNGVNLEVFNPTEIERSEEIRAQWGVREGDFVFGYIGGMEEFRRLPEVLDRFKKFASSNDRARLVLYGAGADLERIESERARSNDNLRDRIYLGGILPYAKVPMVLASLDCAIFPFTNSYCSPLKIFEYLAMRLPVIGPDTPTMREAFEDGKHLILNDQSGNDLERHFEFMVTQKDAAEKLANAGSRLVQDNYSWDANAGRLVEFILNRLGT